MPFLFLQLENIIHDFKNTRKYRAVTAENITKKSRTSSTLTLYIDYTERFIHIFILLCYTIAPAFPLTPLANNRSVNICTVPVPSVNKLSLENVLTLA